MQVDDHSRPITPSVHVAAYAAGVRLQARPFQHTRMGVVPVVLGAFGRTCRIEVGWNLR